MRIHGSVRKYSDFIATHAALQNNIPTDMKTELNVPFHVSSRPDRVSHYQMTAEASFRGSLF